jgi:hypothetical protein
VTNWATRPPANPPERSRRPAQGRRGLLGDAANWAETVIAEGPNAFALPLVPRSVGWALPCLGLTGIRYAVCGHRLHGGFLS